jgi:hypothetical protein
MMAFALSLLLLAVDPGAPDVRGAGRCPSPEEVARRLRALVLSENALPAGAWLEIVAPAPTDVREDGSELEVRLMTGAPPRLLGARRLSVSRSCDEAAQAAAVVAASWMANYRSPPPLWFGAAPPPRPAAPTPRTEVSSAPLSAEVHTDGARAADPSLAVGAALGLAAATAGTSAPVLIAELDVRRQSAFRARLLVMGMGARAIALGSGEVAWRRLMAGVGVARSWGTPAAHLQLGGDLLAGAAFISGRGFAENASTTSFEAAAGPWLRAGARLAAVPVTVWVGAQGLVWARAQQVGVDGVVSRDTLPRLDLLVGAGLTWALENRPGR